MELPLPNRQLLGLHNAVCKVWDACMADAPVSLADCPDCHDCDDDDDDDYC
jgi:hypothetical protein